VARMSFYISSLRLFHENS